MMFKFTDICMCDSAVFDPVGVGDTNAGEGERRSQTSASFYGVLCNKFDSPASFVDTCTF